MTGAGGAASIGMTASCEYGSESRKTLLSEREMAADVMASSASSSSVSSVCLVVFIVERDVAARRERMERRAWWIMVGEE